MSHTQVWNSLPPEVTSAPSFTGHLSQASEDSSVHRVIFEHTTIVTDYLLLVDLAVTSYLGHFKNS